MIIWDEIEYGKEIYESEQLKTKKWQYKELSCLVKYMLSLGNKPKEIRDRLNACCNDDLKYLKQSQKRNIFDKIIAKAKNENVTSGVGAVVYKSEMDKVKSLNNPDLEKAIFVMLVYNKWLGNLEWFSLLRSDIFRDAKLSSISGTKQQEIIQQLCNVGYLKSEVKLLKKKDRNSQDRKKQMWSIPLLVKEGDCGEIALSIKNYENLVYRYLNYFYGGYVECKTCGVIFKPSSNRQEYCKLHKPKYEPIEKKSVKCEVCKREFEVSSMANNVKFCPDCRA
jgi:hypothetical protein